MMNDCLINSDTITKLKYDEIEYLLVGTAHVSPSSIREVKSIIENEFYDCVTVEIDAARLQSLQNPNSWEKLDIFKVIKEGKGFLLMASLALASFQKKIGQELEITPGQEMLTAIEVAQEKNVPIVLIDRQIHVTLMRAWRKSSLWGKNKLLVLLIGSIFSRQTMKQDQVESLKKRNELEHVMEELANELPAVKQVLIDERDQYMATSLFQAQGKKRLAVVGAGHIPGMVRWLDDLHRGKVCSDLEEISQIPPSGWWGFAWPYVLSSIFFCLLGLSLFKGSDSFKDIILTMALTTSGFAAFGTILALAHPITILVAIVAAPFVTVFRPFLHLAYFTGFSEAYFRRPRIKDLQRLARKSLRLKDFYQNRFLRILLVVSLSTAATTIGKYLTLSLMLTSLIN